MLLKTNLSWIINRNILFFTADQFEGFDEPVHVGGLDYFHDGFVFVQVFIILIKYQSIFFYGRVLDTNSWIYLIRLLFQLQSYHRLLKEGNQNAVLHHYRLGTMGQFLYIHVSGKSKFTARIPCEILYFNFAKLLLYFAKSVIIISQSN